MIPEAASSANADWEAVAKSGKGPNVFEFANRSLSMLLLTFPDTPLGRNTFMIDAPTFELPQFLAVAARSQVLGRGTLLQAETINKCECTVAGDTAEGFVAFNEPGLFHGEVEFTADRSSGKWKLTQFRLPDYRVRLRRDDQGDWKLSGEGNSPVLTGLRRDAFFVTVGGSRFAVGSDRRSTLNEQPVEPAAFQQAFAAAWNDYAAMRDKKKLPPILCLQLNESEPVKLPLEILAHVRRTKGCVVRLTSATRNKTSEQDAPELRAVEFKVGDLEADRQSESVEAVTFDCKADASGKLESIQMGAGVPFKVEEGSRKPTQHVNEFQTIHHHRAKVVDEPVPRVFWIVDDSLSGTDFLAIGAAIATVWEEQRRVPYGGFITPYSATDPSRFSPTDTSVQAVGGPSSTNGPLRLGTVLEERERPIRAEVK